MNTPQSLDMQERRGPPNAGLEYQGEEERERERGGGGGERRKRELAKTVRGQDKHVCFDTGVRIVWRYNPSTAHQEYREDMITIA